MIRGSLDGNFFLLQSLYFQPNLVNYRTKYNLYSNLFRIFYRLRIYIEKITTHEREKYFIHYFRNHIYNLNNRTAI